MAAGWTDQDVESLKVLLKTGISAARIAEELGREFSRNAVIGKVARLGLSLGGLGAKKPPTGARAARREQQRQRRAAKGAMPKWFGKAPAVEATPFVEYANEYDVPLEQRKKLLDLESGDCRWPCGDPRDANFFFCGGAKTRAPSPYCSFHARIARQ